MENTFVNYFVFDCQKRYCSLVYESVLYRMNPFPNVRLIRRKSDMGYPMAPHLFCFDRDKYPVCMGCGTLGTTFFFFGGYIVPKGVDLEHAYRYGTNYSDMLYILDTTLIGATRDVKEIEDIIETQKVDVKKRSPIVLTVGDKLYVLPRNLASTDGILPNIQSYQPHTKKWENFNIFEQLMHDSSFLDDPEREVGSKDFPQYEPKYDVCAHCVKGHEIIIILQGGAYSFDTEVGKLRRLRPENYFCQVLPFLDRGACVDDTMFGLLGGSGYIVAHKESPFGLSIEDMTLTSVKCTSFCYFRRRFMNCSGLIMPVEDAGEDKLLVIRSGMNHSRRPSINTIYFTFDLFRILKDANGRPRCRASHSTMYQADLPDGFYFYPRACLRIKQINEVRAKSSSVVQLCISKNVSSQKNRSVLTALIKDKFLIRNVVKIRFVMIWTAIFQQRKKKELEDSMQKVL